MVASQEHAVQWEIFVGANLAEMPVDTLGEILVVFILEVCGHRM